MLRTSPEKRTMEKESRDEQQPGDVSSKSRGRVQHEAIWQSTATRTGTRPGPQACNRPEPGAPATQPRWRLHNFYPSIKHSFAPSSSMIISRNVML